jgi:hypothetical protein
VSEKGGDGEAACSETPSLLSYILRFVSFAEVGSFWPVSRGIKVKMGWFTVFTSRFSCVMNFVKGNEYSDGGVKMVSEVFRNMG